MKAQGRYYPPARPGVATRIALRVVRPKEEAPGQVATLSGVGCQNVTKQHGDIVHIRREFSKGYCVK
jgi:hypothetical protein